jgi:hypothetical protein
VSVATNCLIIALPGGYVNISAIFAASGSNGARDSGSFAFLAPLCGYPCFI